MNFGERKGLLFRGNLILFLAALWVVTGCADKGQEAICGEFPMTAEERLCVRDNVEARVLRYYPFAKEKGVDLREFSRQVRGIDPELGDLEFLTRLQQKVATLEDGHTQIGLPAARPTGTAPVGLRDIKDEVYVTWSAVEAVEAGDQLLEINGVAVEKQIEAILPLISASIPQTRRRIAAGSLLSGPLIEDVAVTLRRGEEVLEVVLLRLALEPGLPAAPEGRRFGDIGYIRVPSFVFLDDVEVFDGLLREMKDASAVILDLRSNGGGKGLNPDLLVGRFLDEEVEDFELQSLDGEVKGGLRAVPRGEPFAGELVVLTDVFSYSAANYLVHRVRFHDLGITMGERSGGGSAQRIQVELVEGLPFIYSRRLLVDPAGEQSEAGFAPDIPIELTPEDLRKGLAREVGDPQTDAVLAEALRLIEEGL